MRRLWAVCLLWLSVVPGAVASEWDEMRETLREKLRVHEGRIAEIDAQQHGDPADPEKRAEKITRDRIARLRAALKSGGDSTRVPDAVEAAWGPSGADRRMRRQSIARLQKDLESLKLNLETASEALDAMASSVPESGVPEKIARIEALVNEVSERLGVRWQREHDARERERLQREREAAERARGVR